MPRAKRWRWRPTPEPGSSTPRPRTGAIPTGLSALPSCPKARRRIAGAQFVSNPGCYSTGAIALISPLVGAGLLPADYPVTINAVSGYTGGGKQ
jgi:N-acetyl-gamma-glutamylphosphate reductase